MVNIEIVIGIIAIAILGAVFIPLAFDASVGGVDFIDCEENEIIKYTFVNGTLRWICGVDETTVTEGVVGTFANENTEFRPHLVQGFNVQDPIKDFGEYSIRVLEYLPFEFGEVSWDYLVPQDYELGEDLEFIVYWLKEDGLPDDTIIQHYNEESTACQSTTSTATPLNIMAGVEFNFTANRPYLLMVNTAWGNDEAHEGVSVLDVRHGSTVFEGSRQQHVIHSKTALPCNIDDDFYKYFWWTVYTPNATEALEDLTFNVDNTDNLNFVDLGAVVFDDTTFSILDLSSLTENDDYFFEINNTKSDILNLWATESSSSITITPTGNQTDWLILGTNLNNQTSKDYSLETRLLTSGSQSDVLPHVNRGGEAQTTSTGGVDAFENDLHSFARVFNVTQDVPITFTIQTQIEDGQTNPDPDQPFPDQRLSNSIFALNLDVFSDHAFVWKPELQLVAGDDFTSELASLNVTSNSDDKKILVIAEVGITKPLMNLRGQIDQVDILPDETLQSYDWEDDLANSDIARWTLTTITSPVSNATHVIDLDGGKSGGKGTKEIVQTSLVAFILESFPPAPVAETVCMEVRLMSVDVGEDMSSSISPTHTPFKEACATTLGGADILRTLVFNFNATENPFESEEVGVIQLKRHSDNSTSDDYVDKVFVLFGELQWVVEDP